MSVVRKMVSLKKEDADYLQSNSISLSKFVRNNIEKLKETRSSLEGERDSNPHDRGYTT
ncbi:MAG: hypothetical protein NPMRTH1_50010 [Nitrosopumilales archaeon]|nr:MAG: hypothetical protein NPMRTH1_50010 [Nitrosopumilales archaeon]